MGLQESNRQKLKDLSLSEKSPEGAGRFIITPDAKVNKKTLLYPGEESILSGILISDVLPDEAVLQHSTRSKLAQLGLELFNPSFCLDSGRQLMANFRARVLGPRAIEFGAGQGVACFFDTTETVPLMGQDLYSSIIEQKRLRVSGEFGVDWCLFSRCFGLIKDEDQMPLAELLALRLKDKRWGVNESVEAINFTQFDKTDYLSARDILDQEIFYELKLDEYVNFWVGETRSKLVLSRDIMAWINPAVLVGKTWVPHIFSLLIKPGTQNTIRTEHWLPEDNNPNINIVFAQKEDYRDQYIFLHLYG